MAQRDKIDEMVRMKVAHENQVQGTRIQEPGESRKRALAEIEQDRGLPVPDQVGGAPEA
jgi:hypothetical protein